ncbi:histidine kinase [Rhodomicrobium udaipurense JA643]|uniref:histidine kinase n=2 Tax=Rhodomicrobium udaipurense TaxID=1202716 RepID=A0A8I1GAR4_9HYPH|nr:ATP-binding protein [Rhodomicrobium udaipurense]KAI95804.1 histidine kinase [Rhodomicrobium udaipurense JA643]MBJ7543633.1 CHASE3 domain-containing protein [Rhodomicrobium udaipurense]
MKPHRVSYVDGRASAAKESVGVMASFRDIFTLFRESRREAALLGAAASVLIILTTFSFWLSHRLEDGSRTGAEMNRYYGKLGRVARMMRTVESSQRGYLLAGTEQYLRPYNELHSQLVPRTKSLIESAPSALEEKERLAVLLNLMMRKADEMAATVADATNERRDATIARLKENYGVKLSEQIEENINALQDEATEKREEIETNAAELREIKTIVDVIGGVAVLAFSFLSIWFLMKSNAALTKAHKALEKTNNDLEDIVRHRTAALQRANDEIQRFAYIVSHDLRSPLVNIMGFTSELETLRKELFERLEKANALADADVLSKDFDEAFGFIKSSIARMDRLINAILKISRQGSRPLHSELIEAKALVETVVSNVAHQIREKDGRITVGDLPPVLSDRMSMEQIFSNLIENAIKFLKNDGHGEIKIEGYLRGVDVVYSVSDNGRGIDPRDHQRIFELFRRAGPQDVPGEGMGLAFVSALVRRLGGSIAVESALGIGATFKVTLPGTAAQNRGIAA